MSTPQIRGSIIPRSVVFPLVKRGPESLPGSAIPHHGVTLARPIVGLLFGNRLAFADERRRGHDRLDGLGAVLFDHDHSPLLDVFFFPIVAGKTGELWFHCSKNIFYLAAMPRHWTKTNITTAAAMTTTANANSSCKYSLVSLFMAQNSCASEPFCTLTTTRSAILTLAAKKFRKFFRRTLLQRKSVGYNPVEVKRLRENWRQKIFLPGATDNCSVRHVGPV